MHEKSSITQRIYETIKRRLLDGRFRPGEHIDVRDVAKEMSVSITPVRTALQNLAVERIIESPTGEGFYAPQFNESVLYDLYDWMQLLLIQAVRRIEINRTPESLFAPVPTSLDDIATTTRVLFQSIADTAGQREIRLAVGNANDRLHSLRKAKHDIVEDRDAELVTLAALWKARDFRGLVAAIDEYHEHRKSIVRHIVQRIDAEAKG